MRQTLRFLLPGYYLVHSRLKSSIERVSWLLVNPFVIGGMAFAVSDLPLGTFLIAIALAFAAWQSVYELGYLENDLITTQREAQPTLRVNEGMRAILTRSYRVIVGGKLAVASIAIMGLAILDDRTAGTLSLSLLAGSLIAVLLVFKAHNTFRSRANVATYFVLSSLKYGAIPLVFYTGERWGALLAVVVLVFPVVRTMEHACKVKYGFRRLAARVGDFHTFRPYYYGILVPVLGILAVVTGFWELHLGAGVAGYFLVLRLLGMLVASRVRRGSPPAAYDWGGSSD